MDTIRRLTVVTFLSLATALPAPAQERLEGPFQATGIKIGEVTAVAAIVWTRLTANATCNPADGPEPTVRYAEGGSGRRRVCLGVDYPDGVTVDDLRNGAPGTTGQVRVCYRPQGATEWSDTAWLDVDPDRDFTRQVRLTELAAATRYELRVESRAGADGPRGQSLRGSFRTAPEPDTAAAVCFTVSTGQRFPDQDRPDGFQIYPTILGLQPDFFVHTGDILYYDKLAKDIDLARYHWQRTYGLPTNVEFQRQVASYFIKDDHDTWMDDCWPGMPSRHMGEFTFEQGQAVFLEQVPMGARTWRTFRWGADLQIWLVEGRDFRSPNNMPDGPDKTIWGAEQMAWFRRTVAASDASFRILISPTPVIGPDRPNKRDNHANEGFAQEGAALRQFLASQRDLYVVCGDRHWQYVSVDPRTGVWEFSCGPASDKHAGGWKQEDYVEGYHRFLNVKGGFLSVSVARAEGVPELSFRHHDVEGAVVNEERFAVGSDRR